MPSLLPFSLHTLYLKIKIDRHVWSQLCVLIANWWCGHMSQCLGKTCSAACVLSAQRGHTYLGSRWSTNHHHLTVWKDTDRVGRILFRRRELTPSVRSDRGIKQPGQTYKVLRDDYVSARFSLSLNVILVHGVQVAHRSRLQVSNAHIRGDGWRNKHGIIFVMWIATPLQEIKGLLRNNVRRCASWILVFLDILKIIGNSWEDRSECAKDCTLQPWDQHGFAITTPGPLFREVLAGPLVLLLLWVL